MTDEIRARWMMCGMLLALFGLGACSESPSGPAKIDGGAKDGGAKDGGAKDQGPSPGDGPLVADAGDAAVTPVDASPDNAVPPLDECTLAKADWIFCDSFESGGTWDGSTTNPTLVADPGPFNSSGNHAAQLRVPAGRGGASLYKDLAPQLDKGYLRFYVKWEPGHDFTAPRHGPGGFHGGNTDCVGCSDNRPADWFTSSLETVTTPPHTMQAYTYYPGMYMDCADPNGSCWGDMFPCTAGPNYCTNPAHAAKGNEPSFEAGRWYCLEQMIDAGTPTSSADGASGVLSFWVDGQEIGPWTGLWFRSSADVRLSAIWLYLFHHAEHSVEGLLLDNVIVSRSRIGCPTAP